MSIKLDIKYIFEVSRCFLMESFRGRLQLATQKLTFTLKKGHKGCECVGQPCDYTRSCGCLARSRSRPRQSPWPGRPAGPSGPPQRRVS